MRGLPLLPGGERVCCRPARSWPHAPLGLGRARLARSTPLIHPCTELRFVDDAIGRGVFATRFIPRGTIVWALDELDQRFSTERVSALGRRYAAVLDRYAYVNEYGERVLCWDHARWLNHSCRANVLSTGWDFDIAVEDIAEGQQITNDYGCLNLDRSFRCLCGEPGCRGRIRPDDWDRLTAVWDARIAEAFPAAGSVEQPLWPWVREPRAVRAAMREPSRVPSISTHRFVPAVAQERVRARARAARAVGA